MLWSVSVRLITAQMVVRDVGRWDGGREVTTPLLETMAATIRRRDRSCQQHKSVDAKIKRRVIVTTAASSVSAVHDPKCWGAASLPREETEKNA